MNWYAIHTYSGHENKIKGLIEHKAQLEGLRNYVGTIIVPQKKRIELRKGKKVEVMKVEMPGYVFLQLEPHPEVFSLVTKIPGVTAFLGDDMGEGKPTPLAESEIADILGALEDGGAKPKAVITHKVNDQVKVTEGPFANFIGTVQEIDEERGQLKVMVSIFGRMTGVLLDAGQVESVS
jgi:transcriptional antiterminator NusG